MKFNDEFIKQMAIEELERLNSLLKHHICHLKSDGLNNEAYHCDVIWHITKDIRDIVGSPNTRKN